MTIIKVTAQENSRIGCARHLLHRAYTRLNVLLAFIFTTAVIKENMRTATFFLALALATAPSLATSIDDLAAFANDNVCVQQCVDYIIREGGEVGCDIAS